MKNYFTCESVTRGHPDKICDQISDAILDECLKRDKNSFVACEVTVVNNKVHIMGEITSQAHVNYEQVARKVIDMIGYNESDQMFNSMNCLIDVDIHEQSPDIARGVMRKNIYDSGAGDQGMMFGYACRETKNYMPLAYELANRLTKRLEFVRRNNILTYLRPDGKSQITIEYNEGIPTRVDTIVVSTQHRDTITTEQLRRDVYNEVILPSIPHHLMDERTKVYINPTGRFVVGGPEGDSGLTGRKIIVDTYGGYARHGGGAFSGKDPSKVDRSGAYMARYIAKNIVAAHLADKVEVQISYAIGLAEPTSLYIDTFQTEHVDLSVIYQYIQNSLDLRPVAIKERLQLLQPFYLDIASYGHFGENAKDKPWEQTDLANQWKEQNVN